jgi:hypothetical protein
VLDVGGGGHFGGALVVDGVLPEVFEFIGGFHFGAGLGGAEFGDGAVEEVYLVVEIHHYFRTLSLANFPRERGGEGECTVYGEPFIQVLAVRKLYRLF